MVSDSRVFDAMGFATIVLLAVSIGVLTGKQIVLLPPLEGLSGYRCSTGSDVEGVFNVLTLTFDGARELAETLCSNPGVAAEFSEVALVWRPRDHLQANHIVNEQYDYLWSREHLLRGLVPDIERYYRPLLKTPGYSIYWHSRVGPVMLSPEFFAGKRVGLLNDSHSQTFYVQPFLALKQAGIQLEEAQQRFYPDLTSLQRALESGLVDIVPMAAPVAPPSEAPFSRTLMVSGMSSGEWYLRTRLYNGRLECALAAATQQERIFGDNKPVVAADLRCSGPS